MKMKRMIAVVLVAVMTFINPAAVLAVRVVRLGDAGTISAIAEHFRGEYGMSTHAFTQDILDFNGISWEGARHLGKDTMIKLPPTQAEYNAAAAQIEQQKQAQMHQIRSSIEQWKISTMACIKSDIEHQKTAVMQRIRTDIEQQKNSLLQKYKTKIQQTEDQNIQRIKSHQAEQIRQIEAWKETKLREIKELNDLTKNIERLKSKLRQNPDFLNLLDQHETTINIDDLLVERQHVIDIQQYWQEEILKINAQIADLRAKLGLPPGEISESETSIIVPELPDEDTPLDEQIDMLMAFIDEANENIHSIHNVVKRQYDELSALKIQLNKKLEENSNPWENDGIIPELESPQMANKSINIAANIDGSTQNLKYKFAFQKNGTTNIVSINENLDEAICTWIPVECGKYTLFLTVFDSSGNEKTTNLEYEIISQSAYDSISADKLAQNPTNPNILRAITMFDMVKFDASNAKYLKHINGIFQNLAAKNYSFADDKTPNLENISAKITNVCGRINQTYGISPRPVQALTILRLADEILNGNGAIAEVKTGEGKSFIIVILSIVLAQFDRKVDIVTSNMELAKRDLEDQKKYYDLLEIASGVLFNSETDKGFENGLQPSSTDDYKNSGGYSVEVFSAPIVYSTNFNFEFVFLHSIFRKNPLRTPEIRPYDVVIVDEVDNMLLDQAMSPAIISKRINIQKSEDILRAVYSFKNYDTNVIMAALLQLFPDFAGGFTFEKINMLKVAAVSADHHVRNKDYIIKDSQIQIVDPTTGYVKPGSRWHKFIHEMIEIKEKLKIKDPSASYCAINQKSFFTQYHRISGVTGTVGEKNDENILKKAYNIDTFKVLRHIPSKQIVSQKVRSENLSEIYAMVNAEIHEEIAKGRPVLVIFESIAQVEEFCEKFFHEAGTIKGIEPGEDRLAISAAGKPGRITIATNAAGRGMDIKLHQKALENGGLHVIIPMMPQNERILEQAIGRSARQGQPGSATIYMSKYDQFCKTSDFDKSYENLFELQNRFSQHLKEKWGWIYSGMGTIGLGKDLKFPFGATHSDVMKFSAGEVSKSAFNPAAMAFSRDESVLSDLILDMVLSSWGTFFTELSNHKDQSIDKMACELAYANFLTDLNSWIPKDSRIANEALAHMSIRYANEILKNVDWNRVVITFTITATGAVATIACPGAAPIITTLTGAALEGSLSAYDQFSKNGSVDFGRVGISALGGGAKGFAITSPLGAVATGATVAGIGTAENILDSAIAGDSTPEALKRAVVTGVLEGVTAGGLKGLFKRLAAKQGAPKAPEAENPGGLKPNLQLFAGEKGVGNSVTIAGRGTTGRIEPNNIFEQMAMHEVKSNPLKNAITEGRIKMGDPRWPAEEGWVKMRRVVESTDGEKSVIHFLYNKITETFDDFKFKAYIGK